MTHSLKQIRAALDELDADERNRIKREARTAALEKMNPADAHQIISYAEILSAASGKKWRITEMAALETLAEIGEVLVHGNTGRVFNVVRKHGVVRNV